MSELIDELCFPKFTDFVDKEVAQYIRCLRVENNCTWRSVAAHTWSEFGRGLYKEWDDMPSNQLAGVDLCKVAAEYFGENHLEEPWN